MIIDCIDNIGFEDQLTNTTNDFPYEVQEIGANSYMIENDNGERRWYGAYRFNIMLE